MSGPEKNLFHLSQWTKSCFFFQSECCRFFVYLNIFRLISKMAVFFWLVSSFNMRNRSFINCSWVLKYSLSFGCLIWSALWYWSFKELIFSFNFFTSHLSWVYSISAFLISERSRLTVWTGRLIMLAFEKSPKCVLIIIKVDDWFKQ